jgi:hypothetical protein
MAEPMCKTREAAALLKCSPKKVCALIHAGFLAAVNLNPGGGRPEYRIEPSELRSFRERMKSIPETEQRRRTRRHDSSGEVIQFV